MKTTTSGSVEPGPVLAPAETGYLAKADLRDLRTLGRGILVILRGSPGCRPSRRKCQEYRAWLRAIRAELARRAAEKEIRP